MQTLARCLALFLTFALAAGQSDSAPTRAERFAALRTAGAELNAELARMAFAKRLYREAGMCAREALRIAPEHEIGALTRELEAIDPARYVEEYEQACTKEGRSFRKEARKKLEPHAALLAALADETAKAGDAALAESIWLDAWRADEDNIKAKAALAKLDYEVIFNYGVLPKEEKDGARRALKRLGGGFLTASGLSAELEFWVDAWGLDTRHYRFVTNAPHSKAFGFAQACEDIFDGWHGLMSEAKVKLRRPKDKLTVYFFDSTVTYQAMLRAQGVEPLSDTTALGFYDPTTNVGYFYDNPSYYGEDATLLRETFYHECSHQLCEQYMKAPWKGGTGEFPLEWVNEGFSTYLETLEVGVTGDQRSFTFGGVLDDDLAIGIELCATGTLPSYGEFVHWDAEEWKASESSYQQATLLVHYLMHADKGKLAKHVFASLQAELESGGLTKSFFEITKLDAEQLDPAIASYAKDLGGRVKQREYAR